MPTRPTLINTNIQLRILPLGQISDGAVMASAEPGQNIAVDDLFEFRGRCLADPDPMEAPSMLDGSERGKGASDLHPIPLPQLNSYRPSSIVIVDVLPARTKTTPSTPTVPNTGYPPAEPVAQPEGSVHGYRGVLALQSGADPVNLHLPVLARLNVRFKGSRMFVGGNEKGQGYYVDGVESIGFDAASKRLFIYTAAEQIEVDTEQTPSALAINFKTGRVVLTPMDPNHVSRGRGGFCGESLSEQMSDTLTDSNS